MHNYKTIYIKKTERVYSFDLLRAGKICKKDLNINEDS